ncbi:spore germination protein KA [Scopulibacillus darangshiensis]|uniref:Spore germination protein KA n=1 Tax=Scopulibacillus darangshiensis TaxID=442528 RepID=A0A4R2NM80_9BACL|nr:spore germination protein [Scopulibacillus darangshiensis]TCP22661.1 spore germination protein KA [Scopulibacillus darangshiensis]
MNFFKKWSSSEQTKFHQSQTTSEELVPEGEKKTGLKNHLEQNRSLLQQVFGDTSDFHIEKVYTGNREGLVCYLESMVKHSLISEQIMKPLSQSSFKQKPINKVKDLDDFRKSFFGGINFHFANYKHEAVWHILSGCAVIFIEGITKALAIEINGTESRAITEPTTQTIVRGPKDAFVEDINTNISLVRRRLKNPRLRFETYHIGKDTLTSVNIGFIEGTVNEEIIAEVRKRISRIDINAIFDSGNLEELITDKTFTPFPTIYSTERPDTVTSNLIEGKVAIFVGGSPFILLVPTVFTDFFEVSEDYYVHFFLASFLRIIRYMAFLIALLLPSFYVAIMTFHHELIPTRLFFSLAAQREGVPFPTVVEVLLMEITFEFLREAGARMPRAVGQTISIVGALVIGQAAVEAGIVSNAMIIIVAITGICNYVSPVYNFGSSSRLLRFLFIFFSALLGFYGIILIVMLLVAHLVSLRSFGIPYLAPVAPFIIEDQDDVFVRFPIWGARKRPSYLNTGSPIKSYDAKSPSPPPKRRTDS